MSSPYPEFVVAVRILLALIFAAAALSKFRHLTTFEGVVANYRLLPEWLVKPFSYALPILESALCIALLAGIQYSGFAAAALLCLFALAMGINILRGRTYIDCGCFSSVLKQSLRWSLVIRNLLLAILAAFAGASLLEAAPLTAVFGVLGGLAAFLIVQSFNVILSMPARRRRPA